MRKFTFIIITVIIFGCENKTNNFRNPEETVIVPKPSEAAIKSFNEFFKSFNTDSTLQKSRVKFPLRIDVTNPHDENHSKDKKMFIEEKDFAFLDLGKFESDLNFEVSKSIISEEYAKLNVRAVKTNDYKIFHFIVKEKKWILESIREIPFSNQNCW